MRVGLALPSMVPGLTRDVLLAWMRGVDAGPFSVLAAGERIAYPNQEMMTLLAGAATVTERVRIEATVSVAPMHSAIHLAKQAATIDVLSNGRFVLGVGVGGRDEDYRAMERPFTRRHALARRAGRDDAPGLERPLTRRGSGTRRAAARPSGWSARARGGHGAEVDGTRGPVGGRCRRIRPRGGCVAASRPGSGTSSGPGPRRDAPAPRSARRRSGSVSMPARRARLHDYAYRYLRIFGDAAASRPGRTGERLVAECGPGLPDCPRRCRLRRGDPRGDDRRPRRARAGHGARRRPRRPLTRSRRARPDRGRLPRNIVTLGGHQWSRSSRKLASRSARSSK